MWACWHRSKYVQHGRRVSLGLHVEVATGSQLLQLLEDGEHIPHCPVFCWLLAFIKALGGISRRLSRCDQSNPGVGAKHAPCPVWMAPCPVRMHHAQCGCTMPRRSGHGHFEVHYEKGPSVPLYNRPQRHHHRHHNSHHHHDRSLRNKNFGKYKKVTLALQEAVYHAEGIKTIQIPSTSRKVAGRWDGGHGIIFNSAIPACEKGRESGENQSPETPRSSSSS